MKYTRRVPLMSAEELYLYTLEFEKRVLELMKQPYVRQKKKRPCTPMKLTVGDTQYRLLMNKSERQVIRNVGHQFNICGWSTEYEEIGHRVTKILRGYHVQAERLPAPLEDAPVYFVE